MKHLTWLFLLPGPAPFAQTNAGAIAGTVFDPRKAVMGGVRIKAVNLLVSIPLSNQSTRR